MMKRKSFAYEELVDGDKENKHIDPEVAVLRGTLKTKCSAAKVTSCRCTAAQSQESRMLQAAGKAKVEAGRKGCCGSKPGNETRRLGWIEVGRGRGSRRGSGLQIMMMTL